jgi:DoxX-like protein
MVPRSKLATIRGGEWVQDVRPSTVKAIAVLEVLGAVGLTLPAVLDIAEVFVPIAAVGVVLLMVGAMVTHFRRGESKMILVNLAYLGLVTFVAWGRLGPQSFTG